MTTFFPTRCRTEYDILGRNTRRCFWPDIKARQAIFLLSVAVGLWVASVLLPPLITRTATVQQRMSSQSPEKREKWKRITSFALANGRCAGLGQSLVDLILRETHAILGMFDAEIGEAKSI